METPMLYLCDGQIIPPQYALSREDILFPGSFNPYHNGHKQLADHVFALTGNAVIYMLNITHPDKPEIAESEIQKRIKQFEWKGTLLITRGLNLFIDKAREYPRHRLILGMDTLDRMLDQKYYDFSVKEMMDEFVRLGTRFFVGKRPYINKNTKSTCVKKMDDVLMEHKLIAYKDLFQELNNTPNYLNSTSIRNQTGEKG